MIKRDDFRPIKVFGDWEVGKQDDQVVACRSCPDCRKENVVSVTALCATATWECSKMLGGCGKQISLPQDVLEFAREERTEVLHEAAETRMKHGGSGAFIPI